MALRISIDPPTAPKGLANVSATEALGPGAELAQPEGELPETAPAAVNPNSLGGLLAVIGVGVLLGIIFSTNEALEEESE